MGLLAKAQSWKMKAQSAAARVANMREKMERPVEVALRSAKVQGGAFAMAYAQGRFGDTEVLGMPMPLLAGIGLHGAGFILDTKQSQQANGGHLHDLGDGVLAAYVAETALGMGLEAAAKEHTGGDVPALLMRRASGLNDDGTPKENGALPAAPPA